MSDVKPKLRTTDRSLPIALLRARETIMAPFRDLLAKSGVSEQKWRVLRVLSENGPMEPTAIADAACLLLPSLTRMLGTMEKEGQIRREPDQVDRRKTIVTLDAAGEQLIAEHSEASAQIMAKLEDAIGADDLEQLLDLLDGLHKLKDTAK